MACGIPARHEGLVPLPAAPRAFPPTGIHHLPSPFSHFVSECPITDLDMTSYADYFMLLHLLISSWSSGEGKPTMYHLGEVSRWETTGHSLTVESVHNYVVRWFVAYICTTKEICPPKTPIGNWWLTFTALVRLAIGKQLFIAPHISSVTLFPLETHQSWLQSQVWISDEVAPLNKVLKSWVSRWIPASPSPLTPAIVSSELEGPSILRKL